jgi:hypothetical protein
MHARLGVSIDWVFFVFRQTHKLSNATTRFVSEKRDGAAGDDDDDDDDAPTNANGDDDDDATHPGPSALEEELARLGAASVPHLNQHSLLEHCVKVRSILEHLGMPEHVCDAGLFHSAYGSELFPEVGGCLYKLNPADPYSLKAPGFAFQPLNVLNLKCRFPGFSFQAFFACTKWQLVPPLPRGHRARDAAPASARANRRGSGAPGGAVHTSSIQCDPCAPQYYFPKAG